MTDLQPGQQDREDDIESCHGSDGPGREAVGGLSAPPGVGQAQGEQAPGRQEEEVKQQHLLSVTGPGSVQVKYAIRFAR